MFMDFISFWFFFKSFVHQFVNNPAWWTYNFIVRLLNSSQTFTLKVATLLYIRFHLIMHRSIHFYGKGNCKNIFLIFFDILTYLHTATNKPESSNSCRASLTALCVPPVNLVQNIDHPTSSSQDQIHEVILLSESPKNPCRVATWKVFVIRKVFEKIPLEQQTCTVGAGLNQYLCGKISILWQSG